MADKIIMTTGKRKMAIARATARAGTGKIKINNTPLESIPQNFIRLRIKEAVSLCAPNVNSLDMDVNVKGGGMTGQTDAIRMAIVRAVLASKKDSNLKEKIVAYDRSLITYDPRRTEPHKPSRSSKGARRKKQLSKR